MLRRSRALLSAVLVSYAACGGRSNVEPTFEGSVLTLPAFDSMRVRLHDGEGEASLDDGTVIVRAGLTDWRGVSHRESDGDPEAAAVVWASGGGSGVFYELAAFDLDQGVWRWRGSASLGDRVRVRVLAMTGDEVTLQLTQHGPDDPMCCPTERVERRFRLVPKGVEEVAAVDEDPPTPNR